MDRATISSLHEQESETVVQLAAGLDARQLDWAAGRPAARDMARLQGDADLHARLAAAGFEGSDWDRFADVLVEYGWAVLRAWISTGAIYRQVFERAGIWLQQPPSQVSLEEGESLSGLVIADALNRFRDRVLRAGSWDYSRGASLSTYWIGYCLFRFPDNYRRWLTEQRHWHLANKLAQGDPTDGIASVSPDPAGQIELEAELADALSSVQVDVTKQILQLKAQGYSHIEIAELLDCTTKSIESRLARHWRSARAG